MKRIKPVNRLEGKVRIPGSKSITHRAIITASLARGESIIKNYLSCEDTLYTQNALRELGVKILEMGDDLKIIGQGDCFDIPSTRKEIFMGNSGTSFRLLLSVIALARGDFIITGVDRMLKRPIGALVKAVRQLGVDAVCVDNNDCPPVNIKANGINGGKASIQGNQSSQFISSILLSGPYTKKGVELEIEGELVSSPYVDITIDVMKAFGIDVEQDGYHYFKVDGGHSYRPTIFNVQGDISSASYFWAAAAVTGGSMTTENIYPFGASQGDLGFLDVLAKMGCFVDRKSGSVKVVGGKLRGIDVDMSSMPDMVPTLAAIALFAEGRTRILNVPHLRFKESDRLKAVATEWQKLGGKIDELDDGLIIHGRHSLNGGTVDPHDDHRLAMSLAVIGSRIPGIEIKNTNCVAKSFPNFWKLWDNL